MKNPSSQKCHFRPYCPNQTILFPQGIDKDIAENDPVRLISGIVENLELSSFRKLYKERGRSPYDPKMLLKVVIYAYMNNLYSCRKMEKASRRDVHFIWLSGYEQPDFVTINRFRNRVKNEINNVFTRIVPLLSAKGLVTLDVEYIDGTKMESKADKYTFVWRKTVERNRARLMEKIRALLSRVDHATTQDKAAADEGVSFTPETLAGIAMELRQSLEETSAPQDKEGRKAVRKKKEQARRLEQMRDKLSEYDNHLGTLGGRNSCSKTEPDATFMRMKEDAANDGQAKPGYNLQIATENQFVTDFGFFHNPADTLTMIPFLGSFRSRYGRYAREVCADSGYGSEENYAFMESNGMEAYVKYNLFNKGQKRPSKEDAFRAESLHYNPEGDYFVCPMGRRMRRVGVTHGKTESGYRSESAVYRAGRCEGCPLRWGCHKRRDGDREIKVNHQLVEYRRKARERLTSETGLLHRSKRPIEPEAVFGQMKYNMGYKRFRHFGKDKVAMDFAFFAIAFNVKKMAAKARKRGNTFPKGGLFALHVASYKQTGSFQDCRNPETTKMAA